MVAIDPYNGQYVTAGDPAVDADGNGLENGRAADPAGVQAYYNAYGTLAPQVWAEDSNRLKLASGKAILTPQGVISLAAALSAVQARGYKGASDAASIAQAYALLIATPPSTSAPSAPPAPGGTIELPLVGHVPTLAAAAVGVGAVYFLLGRRR